jgi:hypothetical protein
MILPETDNNPGGIEMGANQDGIRWLRTSFGKEIDAAVKGTPFTANLVIAIALQETGFIWKPQSKKKTPEEVLALCVGDTIDSPKRSAFPKNRAALEAKLDGAEMFKIAREALVNLGTINDTYKKIAAKNPDKFCHGFGMFQYDLQFFDKVDPDYFLKKKWATIDGTVSHCLKELKDKLVTVYGKSKKTLTRDESVYVAIAYNKGSADTSKDFKQGYKDDSGVYYGEHIDTYLELADATI